MMSSTILLIADNDQVCKIDVYTLSQQNFNVISLMSLNNVANVLPDKDFDLAVLNISVNYDRLFNLVEELRKATSVPIIVLAHESDQEFILNAYKIGVSEYVVKPIDPRVFIAKVMSWLRRSANKPNNVVEQNCIESGAVKLYVPYRLITIDGKDVKLTNLETRLVQLLMSQPHFLFKSDEIVNYVWNQNVDKIVDDRAMIRNLVYRLRKKIEPIPSEPSYIISVSEGYLFSP